MALQYVGFPNSNGSPSSFGDRQSYQNGSDRVYARRWTANEAGIITGINICPSGGSNTDLWVVIYRQIGGSGNITKIVQMDINQVYSQSTWTGYIAAVAFGGADLEFASGDVFWMGVGFDTASGSGTGGLDEDLNDTSGEINNQYNTNSVSNSTGPDTTLSFSTSGSHRGIAVIMRYDDDLGTDYLLEADAGSYAKTGSAIGTLYGRKIDIGIGTYIKTGQSIGVLKNRLLDSDQGTYIYSGIDVDLLKGNMISADPGSYDVTGQDIGLLYARILSVDPDAYSLNGQDIAIVKGRQIAIDAGSYSLSGQNIGLRKSYQLVTEVGNYNLDGSAFGAEEYDSVFINSGGLAGFETFNTDGLDITLAINTTSNGTCYSQDSLDSFTLYKITFDYTYNSGVEPEYRTAANAGLTGGVQFSEQLSGTGLYTFYTIGTPFHGFTIPSGTGSFAVSNLSVIEVISKIELIKDSRITIDPGAYSLNGQDAVIIKGRQISIDPGAYSLNGQDAVIIKGRQISLESGIYSINGQDVNFLKAHILGADGGVYNLTGSDVTLIYSSAGIYTLIAESGSYNITGQDLILLRTFLLSANIGNYTLTGQDLSLLHTFLLSANVGNYTLTGQDASVLRGYPLAVDTGAYNVTGQDIDLLRDLILSMEAGGYTIIGQDAALLYSTGIRIASVTFNFKKRTIDFTLAKRAIDLTLVKRDINMELE